MVTHLLPQCEATYPDACVRVIQHQIWSCSGRGLPGRSCHQNRRCALTTPFQHDLIDSIQRTKIDNPSSVERP
jgi:hypothetical protein